jgi:hypothetical protein
LFADGLHDTSPAALAGGELCARDGVLSMQGGQRRVEEMFAP